MDISWGVSMSRCEFFHVFHCFAYCQNRHVSPVHILLIALLLITCFPFYYPRFRRLFAARINAFRHVLCAPAAAVEATGDKR